MYKHSSYKGPYKMWKVYTYIYTDLSMKSQEYQENSQPLGCCCAQK